jgi:hypothetical protein
MFEIKSKKLICTANAIVTRLIEISKVQVWVLEGDLA